MIYTKNATNDNKLIECKIIIKLKLTKFQK